MEVMEVVIEPIWYEYATFDEDGFVNGIRDDAPDAAKDAYKAEMDEHRRMEDTGEPIPR